MRQHRIMLPDSFRDLPLRFRQMQKFCHIRHRDIHGTGPAVTAVHAVSFPPDLRKGRKCAGIISFLVRSFFICGTLPKLFRAVCAGHDGCDGRTCQRVMNALVYRKRRTGRGQRSIQKIPAAEAFHDRDADAHPLTGFIQMLPFRIHIRKHVFISFIRPQILYILACRLKIVARIDGEHQHFDLSCFHGFLRHLRIMTGEADMADPSGLFQFHCIIQDPVLYDILPVRQGIAVMDHADIQIIRSEKFHHLRESGLYFVKLPAPFVLPVLPYGTDV